MENLLAIQSELKVPKGNINKFGNYKYRSAEDILEAAKPILKKYRCLLTLTDEIVQIGLKTFLKASASITDFKSTLTVFGYAEMCEHKGMSAEQATGTASSYARKYALNGLFLIDETEADADFQQKPETKKETPKTEIEWLTEEQFNATMKSNKQGIINVLKAYNGQNGKSMKSEYLKQLTEQMGKI